MPTLQFIRPNAASINIEFRQIGEGPDLVLLHSLLSEMTVFDPLLPELARSQRVTLFNLPGYGASAPARLDGLEAHADFIARALDALQLPASVDVFGSGLGGALALQLGLSHGERVRRLLAAGVAPRFDGRARAPFRVLADTARRDGMGAVLPAVRQRMFTPEFCAAQPQALRMRQAALEMVDRDCFIRACQALARSEFTARLPAIKVPVLVLCGLRDRITPPSVAREVARGIGGAEFREIPDCGHSPMTEQPAMLASLIDAFRAPR